MQTHRSYCRLCPALCGILVTTEGQQVTDVRGDPGHPLSEGYTCPKGRSLPQLHHHAARLDHPSMGRGTQCHQVGWAAILDDLAGRLRDIKAESTAAAVGMYVGTGSAFDGAGRATSRRFMRAFGSRSYYSSGTVDSPCKPLVAELVAGNAALMPHVTPQTRLTLMVGLNPVISHGHLQAFPNPRRRIGELIRQGELWVADPRRTETAALATRHLAPRPDTDQFWLAAVVRELLRHADHDGLRTRVSGLDDLITAVEPFDIETAAAIAGIAADDLLDLVAAIRHAGRIAVDSGTGLTMTPGANVAQWLLWTLCIITDSFDHPDGMWFNPGLLHAFDRANLIPSDGTAGPGPRSRPDLPERVGELPSGAIAGEIETGNLRALIVYGGNLVTALPNSPRLIAALERLDVLAVADINAGIMTDLATHVLPVTGQLERPDLPWFDTIAPAIAAQYTPAVTPPVAARRHAWQVFAQLGGRLGLDVIGGLDQATATSDDVLALMTRRGRATLSQLQESDGPVIDHEVPYGWVRTILPAGGWRVAPSQLLDQLAASSPPAGLALAPSRRMRHLNSLFAGEATGDGRADVPRITLNPDDAAARGITEGQQVRVTSAHGSVDGQTAITDDVRSGTVTIPHGFGAMNVNDLTSDDDLDPLTGMPVYSGLPIQVTPLVVANGGPHEKPR